MYKSACIYRIIKTLHNHLTSIVRCKYIVGRLHWNIYISRAYGSCARRLQVLFGSHNSAPRQDSPITLIRIAYTRQQAQRIQQLTCIEIAWTIYFETVATACEDYGIKAYNYRYLQVIDQQIYIHTCLAKLIYSSGYRCKLYTYVQRQLICIICERVHVQGYVCCTGDKELRMNSKRRNGPARQGLTPPLCAYTNFYRTLSSIVENV